MKYLSTYEELGIKDKEEVFKYFMKNLKHTNRTFEFFIDWGKVFYNINNIEVELNILNYLIGKENINDEFKKLIKRYPDIVSIIPILIAVREKNLEVLVDFKEGEWKYKKYSFKKKKHYSDMEIDDIVEFCDKIGLLNLFANKKIKNIVDYCIGLEVGIGTNGRKNRGGKIMEDIVEWYVKNVCENLNLEYLTQATKSKIKNKWDIDLPVDKSSRQYDFAINNRGRLVLIETNFFSGGGSKLKSVAGEFKSLNDFLKGHHIVDKFIWITDGVGWETAQKPLKEAFENNDYIINTKMIVNGALDEIIKL
ncbi:type II restriction endonuclease [Defluviitalea phaphyphila]|uniref:type II restriction endonuclease n=1 Tax=Defluviitalea phaphyphila TaxID=1473580 RepID=UPI000730EDAA|nr:type II restriction endonuclease [Defluviitalea phaphyphila]